MTIEKQVCGLDLARKLKELGVKQDSAFYWHNYRNPAKDDHWHLVGERDKGLPDFATYSAFTVAELGEMLGRDYFPQWQPDFNRWTASYNSSRVVEQDGGTEAEARSKMLIYLLENKL